VTRADK